MVPDVCGKACAASRITVIVDREDDQGVLCCEPGIRVTGARIQMPPLSLQALCHAASGAALYCLIILADWALLATRPPADCNACIVCL